MLEAKTLQYKKKVYKAVCHLFLTCLGITEKYEEKKEKLVTE